MSPSKSSSSVEELEKEIYYLKRKLEEQKWKTKKYKEKLQLSSGKSFGNNSGSFSSFHSAVEGKITEEVLKLKEKAVELKTKLDESEEKKISLEEENRRLKKEVEALKQKQEELDKIEEERKVWAITLLEVCKVDW